MNIKEKEKVLLAPNGIFGYTAVTKKIVALSVFLLFVLACGVATPSPISNTIKNQPTSTMEVKAKPTNAPKMQAGYTSTVTAEKWLYVRSSASHYAEVVGYLINGEQVTVIECFGVWGRIGMSRWINTIYLDKGCE